MGSHWAGGPLQLPQGDTHKLVESVETSPLAPVVPEGAQGPGSPPTLYPARGGQGSPGPWPSPSMWGSGGMKEAVLTSMNHIISLTQDTHMLTHICKSNTVGLGPCLGLLLIFIMHFFGDKSVICLLKKCQKTETLSLSEMVLR